MERRGCGSAWRRRGSIRDRAPRLMFPHLRLALVIEAEKEMQRTLEAQPLRLVGVDGGRWLGRRGDEVGAKGGRGTVFPCVQWLEQ